MTITQKPLGRKSYGSIGHLPEISGRNPVWNYDPKWI